MMAAAGLLKSGITLLSCWNRSPVGIRVLFPSRPLPHPPFSGKPPSFSLTHSSCITVNAKATARAVVSFCTAADAATTAIDSSASTTDSSSSSSSSSSPSEIASLSDAVAIKEAASLLDIRVGRVLKAWRHPDADSLYVEEVDVGEPEPRIICSGLVNYIPLDHIQGKLVIVLANLKPRNMRNIKSCGMLLAASDASRENIELLEPPEGSLPGERIWFGLENEKEKQPDTASPNQIQKKKIWETVQPHLKTDASCTAVLSVHFMRTAAGFVVSRSLKNASIS
ncbi:hypothetical protein Nepgr_020103 [Nepenthes gracilis]|uniref:tRNA-binding domain-containing protein n=1 Tax=Nepenthes gracilis TaxID=150966 RepID=A0AAD3SWF8_NEPGR|nr:hypothetical protein Nepgr_020103 [Nepenthes gracilis]